MVRLFGAKFNGESMREYRVYRSQDVTSLPPQYRIETNKGKNVLLDILKPRRSIDFFHYHASLIEKIKTQCCLHLLFLMPVCNCLLGQYVDLYSSRKYCPGEDATICLGST